MELQVALDFDFSVEKAEEMTREVREYADIVEAGTPFLMEWGLEGVTALKKAFPDKKILADLKIADAGYREAENAFLAGADIVTVLAITDDVTIQNTVKAARTYGKKVMADMLAEKDMRKRLVEIDQMGVDYICLHTSKDLQKLGNNVSEAFAELKKFVSTAKVALAGGINEESIAQYAAIQPDVIVVGEGITLKENPGQAAAHVKDKMCKYEE